MWFFSYTVVISNQSDLTVQLLSRHWVITHGTGKQEEVRGAGVVGEQPVLEPGESFEYTSYCQLETSMGAMQGSYQMETEHGEQFDAIIAVFHLEDPSTMN
jgi:ApaG protein